MKKATSSARPTARRGLTRVALAAALAAAVLAAELVLPPPAPAGQARRTDGGIPGRIYNPSRLRTRKETPPDWNGRALQPRAIPDPEDREPVAARAEIPSPEPRARGGKGLVRRGKYFYDLPKPPELARPGTGVARRETIPNPEQHVRKRSAALRSSTSASK